METITLDAPADETGGDAQASGDATADPDGEAPKRPSQVGRVVANKYQLTRLLGEGGMGAVYEAMHLLIDRRVAVKFVHTELAWRSDIMSRFSREAKAAGSLDSENIAAVTDFGTDADGTPFLVMEYLVGVDLAHVLASQGPLPVPRACHLVVQACRGLAFAHAKGIVHRDLKPENLFVAKRADGTDLLKILDFGIAKLQHQDTKSATQTGSAIGTPYYMPPEQVRGARTVDHRADVYALGVILYEILSGQKPHTGESYTDVLFHVISEKPIPLSTHRPGLPDELVAIVDKALAFEADARFQTVELLREALVPFVGRDSIIIDAPSQSNPIARLSDPHADTALPPPDAAGPPPPVTPRPELSTDVTASVSTSSPDGIDRASLPFPSSPGAAPSAKADRKPIFAAAGLVGLLVIGGLAFAFGRGGTPGGTEASHAGSPVVSAPAATPKDGAALSGDVSAKTSADIRPDSPAAVATAVITPVPSASAASAGPGASATKGGPKGAPAAAKPTAPATPTKKPANNDLYAP